MIDQTAEALAYLGDVAIQQGNDSLAHCLYEEGLAIWRALDFQPGIAHLLQRLERTARRQEGAPPPVRSGEERAGWLGTADAAQAGALAGHRRAADRPGERRDAYRAPGAKVGAGCRGAGRAGGLLPLRGGRRLTLTRGD